MINNVVIAGILTRDPELKYLPSGSALCNFSLALNKKYKKQSGEQIEEVSFINCVAFGKTGENISQYMSKGEQLAIQGELKQERWEDTNGNKRNAIKVVTRIATFLNNSADKTATSQAQQPTQAAAEPPEAEQDIPF
jgi:single-strand DNA-binding protein